MYNIYLVTKVFFVFTKNKEFQTTSTIKIILSFFISMHVRSWQKRCLIEKKCHPAFFPADVSVLLHSSVRGVRGCLEKYVLVEGLAKLARPNMDIVDGLFFPPLGSQTRPWSMQWFPFRCFGSHSFCTLGYTAETFVGLFRSSLMLTFCWSATGDESDLRLSLAFFPQVMQNLFHWSWSSLCVSSNTGAECVRDGQRWPAQCTDSS